MPNEQSVRLPAAVAEAWAATPPEPAPGQLWRAVWNEVARFVLVVRLEGHGMFVAPVSLYPALATDDAYLLQAGESDFGVPLAVWLGLARSVPRRVLQQSVGQVHLSVEVIRKSPRGRALVSVLEDRAIEAAELEDDMAELVAAPAAVRTLAELLSPVPLEAMRSAGIPLALGLALHRGERLISPEQAEVLAPLAGVTASELVAANPPLPVAVVAELDSEAGRTWVLRLAAERSLPEAEARELVGYGAYALAARESRSAPTDWLARIAQYVRARLGDA